jgi:hypothetical protein
MQAERTVLQWTWYTILLPEYVAGSVTLVRLVVKMNNTSFWSFLKHKWARMEAAGG